MKSWKIVYFALALIISFFAVSCKKIVPSLIDLPDTRLSRGAGIDINARFLSDTEELKYHFKSFLPDSGIVPVLVGIRNNDIVSFRIHSMNSLDLRDEFNGFSLLINGEEVFPLHPAGVVEKIRGAGKVEEYRKYGKKDIAAGAVFPPLGAYYAWKGFKEYREFRPMVKASLFPALYSGMFEPLVLEPGDEVNGYLYFLVKPEDVPYVTREIEIVRLNKKKTGFVHHFKKTNSVDFMLTARLSVTETVSLRESDSFPANDSLHADQAFFCRTTAGIAGSEDETSGFPWKLFTISSDSEKASLSCTSEKDSGAGVAGRMHRVKIFGGKSATIVDAVQRNDLCACAINFKRKSQAYILRTSNGSPEVVTTSDYDRQLKKIFLLEHGFLAVTEDGFCYFERYDSSCRTVYKKLGNDLRDAAFSSGGKLLVFSGRKIDEFGTAGDDLLKHLRRKGLPGADRRVVGQLGNMIILVHSGKGVAGDTLVSFDSGQLEETARMPFSGMVQAAEIHAGGILVQLDEGTIIDLAPLDDGNFRIHESAWLPVRILAARKSGGIMTAVTESGNLVRRVINDLLPQPGAGLAGKIFTTPVGVTATVLPGGVPSSRK